MTITKVLSIAGQNSRHISWDLRGFFFGTLRNFYISIRRFLTVPLNSALRGGGTWETLLMTIQAKAYTILVCKYEVQQTIPPLV